MARAVPPRAPARRTNQPSFERTARRWYLRRKLSILYGCRIALTAAFTIALCLFLLRDRRTITRNDRDGDNSSGLEADEDLVVTCIPRSGDGIDSLDPLYRPYLPLEPPPPPFPVLSPTSRAEGRCLESWLAAGEAECGTQEWKHTDRLDVAWTWVNGSDSRWDQAMAEAAKEEGIYSPGFHYREQNELQYSMRSVVSALSPIIRMAHLVVADFPYIEALDQSRIPQDDRFYSSKANVEGMRVAQTPRWLHFDRVGCEARTSTSPGIQLVTHSDIFHLPSRIGKSDEHTWRTQALPSFNSKTIESRLGWVPGLAEVVLSFNDDFFLLRPHGLSDFYTTLYGTVIRFDDGFYQQVRPILDKKNLNDAGETGGLWHANFLLSKRFPKRLRRYLPHVPKVVTRSLHHEAALMFEKDLYISTQRRFRESTRGVGDIQLQWLLTSLRVERWREALLWTFIVAKLGTSDDVLDLSARNRLDHLLTAKGESQIAVVRGPRSTLAKMEENLVRAGLEPPKATEMLFSSLDGHLPPIPRPGISASENDKCTLDLDDCFGTFWTEGKMASSSAVFKRIAFERPGCGDCLIMALVTASGPLGLSAFMPDVKTIYKNKATTNPTHRTPLLPITDTWQAADFSLQAVIRDTELPGVSVDLRRYTSLLLSRYLYMSGRSKTQFHMIDNPEHATRAFAEIDADSEAAMLGLNDNIQRDATRTGQVMTAWFQRRWPDAVWWERPV